MKKHIEVHAPSLAECYARLRDMLAVKDLGHEAWVTVDIDPDSKFDGSYIFISEEKCKQCRHGNDAVGCSLDETKDK